MRKHIEELDKNFRATRIKTEAGLNWHTVDRRLFVADGLPWFTENGVTPTLQRILRLT